MSDTDDSTLDDSSDIELWISSLVKNNMQKYDNIDGTKPCCCNKFKNLIIACCNLFGCSLLLND